MWHWQGRTLINRAINSRDGDYTRPPFVVVYFDGKDQMTMFGSTRGVLMYQEKDPPSWFDDIFPYCVRLLTTDNAVEAMEMFTTHAAFIKGDK